MEELFDDRLHLPGIARPVVLEECGGGLLVQGNCGSTSGKGLLRDEMVDDGEDILFPLPEGRNCNGKCVETVIQVGTKVLFCTAERRFTVVATMSLKETLLGYLPPKRVTWPVCQDL